MVGCVKELPPRQKQKAARESQTPLVTENNLRPTTSEGQTIPIRCEGQNVSEVARQLESQYPEASFVEILEKLIELSPLGNSLAVSDFP